MEELGYVSNYRILNARNFGIPQDRNRVITVSILDNQTENNEDVRVIVKDLLGKFMEQNVDDKYYLTDKQLEGMKNWKSRKNPLNNIYTKDSEYIRTIVRRSWGDLNAEMGLYQDEKGIRKFTEKEVWRLMGFDDEDFERAAKVSPSKELYQQAGNSIVVNVLEAILKELLLEENK
jgi:DNA (cytosine-5)-methyltransferase 1